MGFNRFTKSVLNISGLPDRVQNQATTLKALFDQAGVDIKEALNALMSELEASTSANNIGADVTSVATKTVQAILTAYEEAIADRYTKLEAGTLVLEETNNLVADVDVNLTTGVITVTKKDGTIETFDTAIEKVPAKFEIVENNGKYLLKVTNLDGTSTQTDITTLMNIYTFNNSDTINFEVTGEGNEKAVVATIKANSIGLDKLSLTVISELERYTNNAKDSANAAKTSEIIATNKATEAKNNADSCAILTQTVRTLYSETIDITQTAIDKADEAAASAEEAKKWAEQAGGAAGDLSGYYTKVETDEKIEEAISNIEIPEGEGDIPKFVGTIDNPIDFSNLFEGIETAVAHTGHCILEGYCKVTDWSHSNLGVKHLSEIFPGSASVKLHYRDSFFVSYSYKKYSGDYGEIQFGLDIADELYILYGFEKLGLIDEFDNGRLLTTNNTTSYNPTGSYNPATKKYVDDKRKTFTATIPVTGWTTGEQNYVDVTVSGILESDYPHITPVYTNVKATDDAIEEAWNKIKRAPAINNGLRVYADEIPATTIPVQIEIVR